MFNEIESGIPEEAKKWKAPDDLKFNKPESKERNIMRREYEYRDNEGNLIARAKLEIDPDQERTTTYLTKEGREGKSLLLKSFVLESEQDEQAVQFDVLELANLHDAKIFMAEQRLTNYCCSDDATRVEVPPLETPLDVAVLLHELGHVDQNYDSRFRQIYPLYERSREINRQQRYDYNPKDLEVVRKSFPQLEEVLDPEFFGRFEQLNKERARMIIEGNAIEDEMDRLGAEHHERIKEVLHDLVNRQSAYEEFEQVFGENEEVFWSKFSQMGFSLPDGEKIEPYDAYKAVHMFLRTPGELQYDPDNQLIHGEGKYECAGKMVKFDLSIPMTREEYSKFADFQARNVEAVIQRQRLVEELSQNSKRKKEKVHEIDELVGDFDIKDILLLPMRVLERDATRRAFEWLRTIKKRSGIDLLKNIMAKKSELKGSQNGSCRQSLYDDLGVDLNIVTSVREDLNRALRTYKSERVKMVNRKGRRVAIRAK